MNFIDKLKAMVGSGKDTHDAHEGCDCDHGPVQEKCCEGTDMGTCVCKVETKK